MSENRRAQVAQTIERCRVSAIIRTDSRDIAARAMAAAVAGGFRMVEFTLTTPGAVELIEEFARDDRLLVGAGTVMAPQQARRAVEAGARFLVSPIGDPAIIAEAGRLDVVSIPGAYTPTEMELAHRAGADFIKIFPAPAGGIEFVQSIRGPLPHLRLFPTAGVTPDNFADWLAAGCAGVGFVRSLFDPGELARGDFEAIQRRATEIRDRLTEFLGAK